MLIKSTEKYAIFKLTALNRDCTLKQKKKKIYKTSVLPLCLETNRFIYYYYFLLNTR